MMSPKYDTSLPFCLTSWTTRIESSLNVTFDIYLSLSLTHERVFRNFITSAIFDSKSPEKLPPKPTHFFSLSSLIRQPKELLFFSEDTAASTLQVTHPCRGFCHFETPSQVELEVTVPLDWAFCHCSRRQQAHCLENEQIHIKCFRVSSSDLQIGHCEVTFTCFLCRLFTVGKTLYKTRHIIFLTFGGTERPHNFCQLKSIWFGADMFNIPDKRLYPDLTV